MKTSQIIENILTLLITTGGIIGLYIYGAGTHSFWLLILLGNLNYLKRSVKLKNTPHRDDDK